MFNYSAALFRHFSQIQKNVLSIRSGRVRRTQPKCGVKKQISSSAVSRKDWTSEELKLFCLCVGQLRWIQLPLRGRKLSPSQTRRVSFRTVYFSLSLVTPNKEAIQIRIVPIYAKSLSILGHSRLHLRAESFTSVFFKVPAVPRSTRAELTKTATET